MTKRVAIGPSSFAAQDKRPLEYLTTAGVEVVPNPYGRRLTEDEIIKHLKDTDGLIAGLEPLNRRVLMSNPRLKAVARVGIGMDNIDVEAATELGIKVTNTPDEPTAAVAEMTLSAALALCRGILPANAALHDKRWEKSIGIGLSGAKVLLIGYGRIGRSVARLMRTLGAQILVFDPYIKDAALDNVRIVSLEEGLKEAEIISLHASGRKTILDSGEFAIMRDGVILLNGARGELVSEKALIQALQSGKVRGVWLDVFWDEPYHGRLTEFDQVLLTPHIGTYTRQCRLGMEMAAVKNLLHDLGIDMTERIS